jgi:hypothetical protein
MWTERAANALKINQPACAFLFRRLIDGDSISFDLDPPFPQLSSRVADTLQPIGVHTMEPARKKCRAE